MANHLPDAVLSVSRQYRKLDKGRCGGPVAHGVDRDPDRIVAVPRNSGLPLLVLRARRGNWNWSRRFRCGCRPEMYDRCRRGRSSPDRRDPAAAAWLRRRIAVHRAHDAVHQQHPVPSPFSSMSLATKSVSGQSDSTCKVTRTLPAISRRPTAARRVDQPVIRQRLHRPLVGRRR